ncbi:MAG TPA: glutamate--cysteine ligase [Burkholderiales bacterium]|nr:glutamate--cysteine ligase [Burkholderiales bacterium]
MLRYASMKNAKPMTVEQRLAALPAEALLHLRRGVEKESLRTLSDGGLAMTPHPAALGSALTHPHITTDFSESQLELITGVHDTPEACIAELTHIHQVVYRHIGDQMLWCGSMPCKLPPENDIPLGRYGSSNLGRMKTVYRMGLSYRYGRRMQTISGIHYNFSVPDAVWDALDAKRDDGYFALIRNFRRHSWLLLYLFGASPATCSTFVEGRPHKLEELRPRTMYLPYATSLRMGPLGYQSDAQALISASYNGMNTYASSLFNALTRPYAPYEQIGIREGDEYRQLNTTLLQIENEFYGTIRPKRRIHRGERPLHALSERGVEYVEVRLMDLDPFEPVGINAGTMRFLDVFLLHCLLSPSPPDTPDENRAIGRNQHRTAAFGREPGLQLDRFGTEVSLRDWGDAVLDGCAPVAAALDSAHSGRAYRDALERARQALREPAMLSSSRVLDEIQRQEDGGYVRFIVAQSRRHRAMLLDMPLPDPVEQEYQAFTRSSLAEQRAMEEADNLSFEEYRKAYLAQKLL